MIHTKLSKILFLKRLLFVGEITNAKMITRLITYVNIGAKM